MSRTLLGRLRFVAVGPDGRREIVVNPANDVVLRGYFRADSDERDGDDARSRGPWGSDDGPRTTTRMTRAATTIAKAMTAKTRQAMTMKAMTKAKANTA